MRSSLVVASLIRKIIFARRYARQVFNILIYSILIKYLAEIVTIHLVLVRRDAEKLKFFNFAASLKKRVADDVEKKTLTIYGARQLGGKKNATSVNLP